MSGAARGESEARGSWAWFINFTQAPTEDDTLRRSVRVVDGARELAVHSTFKCVQTAAVFGVCFLAPAHKWWALRKIPSHLVTKNTNNVLRNNAHKLVGRCLYAGVAAGPCISYGYVKWNGLSRRELDERCVRLRYNKQQLFMDRASLVFAVIGLYTRRYRGAAVRFSGAATGITFAVLYALAFNRWFWDPKDHFFLDRNMQLPASLFHELYPNAATGCDLVKHTSIKQLIHTNITENKYF